ncbi:MAG: desampylase [Halobacteriales archaeon]|nr:desampylase [Halobacteriales archaeon]
MRLADAARTDLLAHACEGRPEEVVGVLVGPNQETITRIERAENVADDPQMRYELDPIEQVGILDAVEGQGETVVGFYHSHPRDPPVPSATDERLATWKATSISIRSRRRSRRSPRTTGRARRSSWSDSTN